MTTGRTRLAKAVRIYLSAGWWGCAIGIAVVPLLLLLALVGTGRGSDGPAPDMPVFARVHIDEAALAPPPDGIEVAGWPMVCNDGRQVYFKPESGGVMMSPMDEAPMDPCDPRPDDLAIAEGFERLRRFAPKMVPRSLRKKWAGLRSFTPDRWPVVGPDPDRRAFFWLAGQGGCGIETSPLLGRVAAELIAEGNSEHWVATRFAPSRFE